MSDVKATALRAEDLELIEATATRIKERLDKHHYAGFGVFPAAEPKENFYNQVYARDFAHAAVNYFIEANPVAVRDSLVTLLRYQRADGALPFRVEREHQMVKLMPGIRRFSKPIFHVLEKQIRGRTEIPVYEHGDLGVSGSEDTVPVVLLAAGEFAAETSLGKDFIKEHFGQLDKAAKFFEKKCDPEDGLAVMTLHNPDWADSLTRGGKLGAINIWWAQALYFLERMARAADRRDDAGRYQKQFEKTKASVMKKLYNAEEHYFRAKVGEDRIDTVASIFGALFFLSVEEAVAVEETFKRFLLHNSGLRNFYPRYASHEFSTVHRLWARGAGVASALTGKTRPGLDAYHNHFVWPWVTLQNIRVKVKIGLKHPRKAVRNQYQQEAVADLLHMSKTLKKAGGAYEILDPEELKPADIFGYTPPQDFMGTLAGFMGAYGELKKLGWI